MKQVMLKSGDRTNDQLLLFRQALGCSEELIIRFWGRMDGVEEVENEVMSTDGVLIFTVTFRRLQMNSGLFRIAQNIREDKCVSHLQICLI